MAGRRMNPEQIAHYKAVLKHGSIKPRGAPVPVCKQCRCLLEWPLRRCQRFCRDCAGGRVHQAVRRAVMRGQPAGRGAGHPVTRTVRPCETCGREIAMTTWQKYCVGCANIRYTEYQQAYRARRKRAPNKAPLKN